MSPKLTLVKPSTAPELQSIPEELVSSLTVAAIKRLNIAGGFGLANLLGQRRELTNSEAVSAWIREYLADPSQDRHLLDLGALCEDLYCALITAWQDWALEHPAPG